MPKTSNPVERRQWRVGAQARLEGKSISAATRGIPNWETDFREMVRAGFHAMDDYLACKNLVENHRAGDPDAP